MSDLRPILGGALRATGDLLSPDDRRWADAIAAELHATESRREQLGIALSGVRGLFTIALERTALHWQLNARMLAVAAALGLLTAWVDLNADSRRPLWITMLASCAMIGILAPRVARAGGVLIGIGLPLLTALAGARGPYAIDRGDVWIPLLPALVLTSLFAALRNRLVRSV